MAKPTAKSNSKQPLISVIIPAYNEEKFIGASLTALDNQTLPRDEFEIIVVDARSKDKTVAVARVLADKVITEKHNSIGGARLDGSLASCGKIIATIDADSTPPSHWLECIKENLTSGEWDACYGPQMPHTHLESVKFFTWLMNITAEICHHLGRPYISGSNSAFTRSIYDKAGRHANISICEDIDLGWRVKRVGGRLKFDPNMVMEVSDRRFRKMGFIKTVLEWKLAELALILNKKPSDSYASQEY